MPITFTALGDVLQVDIIDENFEVVQDFFRSQVLNTDIVGRFNRYHLLRYVGGQIVSATAFANPMLLPENFTDGKIDMIYRYGSDKDTNSGPQAISFLGASDWSGLAMEFLGRPGGSFFYQWQEDGITEAELLAETTSGWPPDYWPISRYPQHLCFSPWLTIPGASVKAFVGAPCVARVWATSLGSLNFSPIGFFTNDSGLLPTDLFFDSYSLGNISLTGLNDRQYYLYRFSLIVDTNPNLHDDEFVNTNPNIVVPGTDSMAPYCSWSIIREHGFYASQRQTVKLAAEVALKGDRFYNFSMKFRDGGIRGWVMKDYPGDGGGTPAGDIWNPGYWGSAGGGATNSVTYDATWEAARLLIFGTAGTAPGSIPFVNLWESGSIHVEFYYGRDTAYSTDSSLDPGGTEFYSKPA